jgi:hypothetical protein
MSEPGTAWWPEGRGGRCPRRLKKRLKEHARRERGRSRWWAGCLTWCGWERGIERRGTHPRARHEWFPIGVEDYFNLRAWMWML